VTAPYGASNGTSGTFGRAAAATPLAAFGTRPPGERDQRDVAMAGGDRLRRMRHMDEVRGAAGLGRVDMAHAQAEVVDHAQHAEAGCIAGAEVAVDVLELEPGIGQRTARAFVVELRGGLVGRLAQRMFPGARDAGFSLDGHARHSRRMLASLMMRA
jgi:hypothetical protein